MTSSKKLGPKIKHDDCCQVPNLKHIKICDSVKIHRILTFTCLVQNPDIYKRAELQRSINQFDPVCRNYVFCPSWSSSLCSVSFASSLLLLPLFPLLLVFFCSSISRVFFVPAGPLQFFFLFCNVIAPITSLSAACKGPGPRGPAVRGAPPPPSRERRKKANY